ncbi:tRNA lysidine(34) synthetase TilS [Bacteroides nordii]|jgi:tRNA(ile)-lysidine synthetase|uniref:tRNA lysidine(34) synthetase TilS n=1 Tax=Bacteroides nordii TaxID=291645 RepID=UPI00095E113A|nr:tRNA lysidine(34) synthetase TilS [Bacteroides nordii]MCE8465950.1 tRNA lysidine(34) synthetase TilS [Bacteroides nordii]OKZ08307.1 MAG: tRNA lysidine(34) synthetase TilS [Bacteroides sp. 41_26]UYU50338.1 tRNA lysidine(34) synthetase TilS [Bacteroides nordii]
MIEKKIAQYIDNERLFPINARIIVALSGGADSVALLRILHTLGYDCEAAHCNFHLRGTESDRDEMFVRKLCKTMRTPLHTIDFATEQYAIEKKISIEMAARELRYQWFAEIKEKTKADVIAVAHHQDDSVETVLLNLIRGTGINGLLGIRPKNGDIVRPLLCISRKEITDYLQNAGQEYMTDSTNLQDEYTRNKIRLNLLPLMQEINPLVKEHIIDTSNYLNDVNRIYNKGIEEGKQRVIEKGNIRIVPLLKEPSPEALLFEILYPLGFNAAQTKNILTMLEGQTGKQFISKDGWRVVKNRELLLIDKKEKQENPPFCLIKEEKEYTKDFIIPREKHIACFDTDKLIGEINLRKWQTGDIFIPFGMKGKKKVSDYLTDRKFSIIQKENQWVLCCGDKIIWIVGERTDNRFRIDEKTKKVTVFKMSEKAIDNPLIINA